MGRSRTGLKQTSKQPWVDLDTQGVSPISSEGDGESPVLPLGNKYPFFMNSSAISPPRPLRTMKSVMSELDHELDDVRNSFRSNTEELDEEYQNL